MPDSGGNSTGLGLGAVMVRRGKIAFSVERLADRGILNPSAHSTMLRTGYFDFTQYKSAHDKR